MLLLVADTLGGNTTGVQNTGIGTFALNGNTTANNNTGVGHKALFATAQQQVTM